MVYQRFNMDRVQKSITFLFYTFMKSIVSVLLGYLTSRCYIFENFSPFSIILLTVSPGLSLMPTACYLSSCLGYLIHHFDPSALKYTIALTMIYVIYMVFRKSEKAFKGDIVVISGACCFLSGIGQMLAERFTLFGILILVAESILVSCCIFFVSYAAKAFKHNCYLTSKEIIAIAITMILLLFLLGDISIAKMNAARVASIFLLFIGGYCLKTSHTAVLGTCLGVLLSTVGNGGEAIFTATIVSTLLSCVFSSFSIHFSTLAFMIAYDIILFFYGKFPWQYPLFAEPFAAYVIYVILPKEKIRHALAPFIAVRENEKKKSFSNQKVLEACRKECAVICPKATLCYDRNKDELNDALSSLAEKYCNTEEFGDIKSAIPFCIKPQAMSNIIRNRLVYIHSEDFEDLVDQLERISQKMKRKMDASIQDVHFLVEAEQSIRGNLEQQGYAVKDINFIEDRYGKRRCDLHFIPPCDADFDHTIRYTIEPYFKNTFSLTFENTDGEHAVHAKERCTYHLSCAALSKTKSGEQISGDQAIGFMVGKSTYYLMLADGMGSGKSAGMQSELIIDTLRKMIEGGFSVPEAIKVYRSALRLHEDGCFASIDICEIDLNTATADTYKAGAYDSYRLSDNQMTILHGGGLPVGLSDRDKLLHRSLQLQSGDFLIMTSDGITALCDRPEIDIARCVDENVRLFARNILNLTSDKGDQSVTDDVTILVCKIEKCRE